MIQSKILKDIVEEYNLKNGMKIKFPFLNQIAKNKNINIKDLVKILGIISVNEYISPRQLLNKKKYVINLYNEYKEYTSQEKEIINKIKNKDYITKKEIEEIRNMYNIDNKKIKNILSINNKNFSNLINGNVEKTRIIIKDIAIKTFLLKMDFKYYETNKFHTKKELVLKSKKLEITLEELVKNITNNIKRYQFDIIALEKNAKGIYIGKEHPFSNSFINKNYKRIMEICGQQAKKYARIYKMNNLVSDFREVAFEKILQNGGILEKNFSFDEELLFTLISSRCKYNVLNECKKIIRENINFRKYSKELNEIINCGISNYQNKDIHPNKYFKEILHQKIIENIWIYVNIIEFDREYGLKIIAHKLEIEYKQFLEELEKIKAKIIEHGLVKKCKNGSIICMEYLY